MLDKSLFKSPRLALEHLAEGETEAGVTCPGCGRVLEIRQLAGDFYTCRRCGTSHKMAARERIAMLLDQGSFEEWDRALVSRNPLGFPGYGDKLSQARAASGEQEAVLTGLGRLQDAPCAFFAMEPAFMMGSMGAAVGEKLSRLFEGALERRLPVVGCTVSGGARVQEGIFSLMQMAKVSGAVRAHSDAGLLYIALLCDATTGGVAASFAMQADIILAEPGALIGFAGPRVIEQTTRQKLPEGFQKAEFQLEKGFLGRLCPRPQQRDLLGLLLRMHEGGPDGRL
ncbi:MAG: acetyl-CoA carboxylase carboxyltransferase subunit beta [Christensenellales bacterium]